MTETQNGFQKGLHPWIQHFASNYSLKNEGNIIWKHVFIYRLGKSMWQYIKTDFIWYLQSRNIPDTLLKATVDILVYT